MMWKSWWVIWLNISWQASTSLTHLRRRLIAIARLGPLEWRYLLASLLLLPLMSHSLRQEGLHGLWPGPRDARPSQQLVSQAQINVARRIARMVNLAATLTPFKASCLVRSLLLVRFLHKRGIGCELEIGGKPPAVPEEQFQAHAWVRCGTDIVNDQVENIAAYQPFSLPASAPSPRPPFRQGN